MKAIVLGAAAGGGFPQWNSNAPACRRARAGDSAAKPRTQASVAVSADGERWFLLNTSPDLRQQIENTQVLHPRRGLRHSPIAGVLLTGGDVDAIAGLLHLRERHAFTVWAPSTVIDVLTANPIFDVLAADCVRRVAVPLETPIELGAGFSAELFPVPGKPPLYLEAKRGIAIAESGDTVGVALSESSSDRRLFFIPGCAAITPALARRLRGAACVLFDGTLWRDDEMIRLGIGEKTGRRMGHISIAGADGAIAGFRELGVERKIFVHLNNSNPALVDDSPERAELEAAGWRVAFDGMEIAL